MTKLQVEEFRNAEDVFVAFGEEDDKMKPVYERSDLGLRKTLMTFPGCLRFMPYAESVSLETMTLSEIKKKYGQIIDRKEQFEIPDD